MAARCLLMGLIALAVARPFVPPGSRIRVVVLPCFLLALVSFTTAVVLRGTRKWFWLLLLAGCLLTAFSTAAVIFENYWNLAWKVAGRKDICIIVDGSTSMQLKSGTGTNFDAAVAEAKEVVEKSGGGNAFSIILGGPVPMARIPEPVLNKGDVLEALTAMKPVRGRMAAFDALATAAVALSRV